MALRSTKACGVFQVPFPPNVVLLLSDHKTSAFLLDCLLSCLFGSLFLAYSPKNNNPFSFRSFKCPTPSSPLLGDTGACNSSGFAVLIPRLFPFLAFCGLWLRSVVFFAVFTGRLVIVVGGGGSSRAGNSRWCPDPLPPAVTITGIVFGVTSPTTLKHFCFVLFTPLPPTPPPLPLTPLP